MQQHRKLSGFFSQLVLLCRYLKTDFPSQYLCTIPTKYYKPLAPLGFFLLVLPTNKQVKRSLFFMLPGAGFEPTTVSQLSYSQPL